MASTTPILHTTMLNDIFVTHDCSMADYESEWSSTFNDRILINVTACFGSTILFAAREG